MNKTIFNLLGVVFAVLLVAMLFYMAIRILY